MQIFLYQLYTLCRRERARYAADEKYSTKDKDYEEELCRGTDLDTRSVYHHLCLLRQKDIWRTENGVGREFTDHVRYNYGSV